MGELRQRLTWTRREMASRLEPLGIQPWLMPRGGFYLWCHLPEGQDSAALARMAVEENVVLAPGNVFSVSQNAASFLRFNVAQSGDPRVLAVLRKAMQARPAG
jgi:DNA-binding transcriptional MocR family regulator